MASMKRSRLLLMMCPLVAAGVLAGCGGSDTATTTDAVTAPVLTSETVTDAASETTVLNVTYRDGDVTGDTSPTVALGSKVKIVITSDASDEVHLHGYDIEKAIAAGGTATIETTADIPGRFELEFHHHPTRLMTLTVR